ncbi:MAG: hypothetical protein EBX50_14490 [Chitinophagia bacterium]|nr:hypothetical protein [Chitinophagia bacterium]
MKVRYFLAIAIFATLFSSCSKSPEKAIDAMMKKADEYMVKGVKPTEEMIIADCADYFDKNFKDDIKWMSKLEVFEPELIKHLNDKVLFDKSITLPPVEVNDVNVKDLFNKQTYTDADGDVDIDKINYVFKNRKIKLTNVKGAIVGHIYDDGSNYYFKFNIDRIGEASFIFEELEKKPLNFSEDRLEVSGIVKYIRYNSFGSNFIITLGDGVIISNKKQPGYNNR